MLKNLKMNFILESKDSGKTWRVIRIDYLVEPNAGQYGRDKPLDKHDYQGMQLKTTAYNIKLGLESNEVRR